MRIPMLPIALIFVFIFLACCLCLSDSSDSQIILLGQNNPLKIPQDNKGMVLGVNEAVVENYQGLSAVLNKFGDDIILPPAKSQTAPEIFLEANNGAVLDSGSETIIFDQAADRETPIASITKLITALVFLNHNPGWESTYEVKPQDIVVGGKIYLNSGEEISLKDLFYLSLVGSANTATKALVRSTGMSEEEFLLSMNFKARELGLEHTNFVDTIGFSPANISTAKEVACMAQAALAERRIREVTLTKKYEFHTLGGRKVSVNNTDVLLEIFPQNGIKILGGKTGFTKSAGYCFVGKFINKKGNEIIAVILGCPNKNSRFTQTKQLVEWAYDNYAWTED